MFGIWIKMIMMANWEGKTWNGILIPRGSFHSSSRKLANIFNVSHKRIRVILDRLFTAQLMAQQRTQFGAIFIINNYDKYQGLLIENNIERHSKWHNERHRKGTHTKEKEEIKEIYTPHTPLPGGGDGFFELGQDRDPDERCTAVTAPGAAPTPTSLELRFEKFYAAYPVKKSRGRAEKAWHKLKPNEQLLATMLAAIERAKTSVEWAKDGGQFIPHPASWLNAKGWKDEYKQPVAARSPYPFQPPPALRIQTRRLSPEEERIEAERQRRFLKSIGKTDEQISSLVGDLVKSL